MENTSLSIGRLPAEVYVPFSLSHLILGVWRIAHVIISYFLSAGCYRLVRHWIQAFAILPLFSPSSPPQPAGFPTKLPDIVPLARGHTAPVLDTAWNPFDDNIVASAGEDGKGEYLSQFSYIYLQVLITFVSVHLEG